MIRLHRGPAPDFWIRQQVKTWTQRWLAQGCDSRRWQWPQHNKKRLNHKIRDALRSWHFGKCAFCETLLGQGEIEHFRAKTRYPFAAFVWRNLFLVCADCNRAKGEQNYQGCLKPDRDDPEMFLWINPITLTVQPRPGLTSAMHQYAEKTIALYQLNRPELTHLYRVHLHMVRLNPAGLSAAAAPSLPFTLLLRSLNQYLDEAQTG